MILSSDHEEWSEFFPVQIHHLNVWTSWSSTRGAKENALSASHQRLWRVSTDMSVDSRSIYRIIFIFWATEHRCVLHRGREVGYLLGDRFEQSGGRFFNLPLGARLPRKLKWSDISIGRVSVDCRSSIYRRYRSSTGRLSIEHRSCFGRVSVDLWPIVGLFFTDGSPTYHWHFTDTLPTPRSTVISTRTRDQPFCQYRRSHVSRLVFTCVIVQNHLSGVAVDTDVATRKMSNVATLSVVRSSAVSLNVSL